jgi:putative spermidine/putrescine transport system ATP-binding protein
MPVGQITVHFSGKAEGRIGIAVRPEKLTIASEEPGDKAIKIKSKVSAIVYYGSTSHVYLENETGIRLSVDVQNEETNSATSIVVGNEMWVSWDPEETLVLPD